jgi:protein SCO1/2
MIVAARTHGDFTGRDMSSAAYPSRDRRRDARVCVPSSPILGRATARPVLSLAAISLALGGCGSSVASKPAASNRQVAGNHLQGLILKPAKHAPPLSLRDYTGRQVSLSKLRGKAVLVTFVYTHCPDVCPVIVANLAAAQRRLGLEARQVRIVAVTVDPWRDTPSGVRSFLAARGALGRIDYLLGTPRELHRVWKAWDVGVSVDTKHALPGHTAIVYGISATGKLEDAYPGGFSPAQIAHDVPLLARS